MPLMKTHLRTFVVNVSQRMLTSHLWMLAVASNHLMRLLHPPVNSLLLAALSLCHPFLHSHCTYPMSPLDPPAYIPQDPSRPTCI